MKKEGVSMKKRRKGEKLKRMKTGAGNLSIAFLFKC